MSRETEKLFKEFHKHIGDKEFGSGEEASKELSAFIEKYNAGLSSKDKATNMTADDYLDMAYEAETEEKSVEYAKKALKEDKNCLDAKLLIIQSEGVSESTKEQLENAIKGETKRLEKEGWFDKENIGHFYGLLETRPYMRIRWAYIDLLIEMGKFGKAVSECEDLIRLNENDNLGVRDKLMILYAALEDVNSAKALYRKYNKEGSFSMLYPLALLYYKLDDYNNAKLALKRIISKNEDYKDFLTKGLALSDDEIHDLLNSGMYRPDTIEEVLLVIRDSSVIVGLAESFNEWAAEECLK